MFDRILWNRDLFLTLNGAHTPSLDIVMQVLSSHWLWAPLCLPMVIIYFTKYNRRTAFYMLLFTALLYACSDLIVAKVFKVSFCVLRPCHDPLLKDAVHLLEKAGGLYGFPSSHATNIFALAAMSSLCIKKKWYTAFVFFFAVVISYSRIYVGKHFPLDIMAGALLGIFMACLFYLLLKIFLKKSNLNREVVSMEDSLNKKSRRDSAQNSIATKSEGAMPLK